MIEELISKVFCTRNCAHLAHWKTDSYAEHTALGEFYDSIIDILDNFVEVYRLNSAAPQGVRWNDGLAATRGRAETLKRKQRCANLTNTRLTPATTR